MIEQRYIDLIAADVNVNPEHVAAAISFFDKGATIPYVARYRKDVTGGLSENKLERVAERNEYFTALTARRQALLENIEKQGKLTDSLRAYFESCDDHITLEDISLPYKKQRNNRAEIAVKKGLLGLADYIWAQSSVSPPPELYAAAFVGADKQVLSEQEALEGARHILAECIAMNVETRREVRKRLLEDGKVAVSAVKSQAGKASRYESFSNFTEALQAIPEDKLLLILRGERDATLRVELVVNDDELIDAIASRFVKEPESPCAVEIHAAVTDAYKRLLRPVIEAEVFAIARRKADETMVVYCREQARNLLLGPPVGSAPLLGVCAWSARTRSLAALGADGNVLETRILEADNESELESQLDAAVTEVIAAHAPVGIAVGSGPGGRETMRRIQTLLHKIDNRDVFVTLTQDVGLNTYVHGPLAKEELPDMNEAARAAVSIGRRLRDPLAELVKVDPAHLATGRATIGVNRRRLQSGIARTVESAVNRVGVDVNTASVELLRYVSGLQVGVAQAIVEERKKRDGFTNRRQFLDVSGIGEKTYQQCVGFLRVLNGDEPLDASAIHPEAYPVVAKIAESLGCSVEELLKAPERCRDLDVAPFIEEPVGPLTLEDIQYELARIGRDPRRRFRPPVSFVPLQVIDDLEAGMVIEGIVTNVTDFGIFVNIGLAEEGLVHRSEIGRIFLTDPKKSLQVGEVIKVVVLQVNKESKKIALSIKGAAKLPLTRPDRRPPQMRDGAGHRETSRDRPPFQRNAPAHHGAEQGRPQRRKGGKDAMPVPKTSRQSNPRSSGDVLLNTALADQLAALREKIVSSKE